MPKRWTATIAAVAAIAVGVIVWMRGQTETPPASMPPVNEAPRATESAAAPATPPAQPSPPSPSPAQAQPSAPSSPPGPVAEPAPPGTDTVEPFDPKVPLKEMLERRPELIRMLNKEREALMQRRDQAHARNDGAEEQRMELRLKRIDERLAELARRQGASEPAR